MATTGMCNSAKAELMQGGHLFNAQVAFSSVSFTTGSSAVGVSSTAGISSGMFGGVSGYGGTNMIVATVDSATQVTLSKAATATGSGSASFTSDQFLISLVNSTPVLNYDPTQTNIGTPGSGTPSTANVGTDEVVDNGINGYNTGGNLLTSNTTPVLNGTTAVTTWSNNPSWTSATFSTTAGIIYNRSGKHIGVASGPTTGRTLGVLDFNGIQTVTVGTLTLLMPTFPGSAIVQIT